MSKKQKTVTLGTIRKGKYGPFLSFDSSVKKVQITREYSINGDTVTEVLNVPVNDNGYLEAGNIEKIEDNFAFRVKQGWVKESDAEKTIEKLKSGNAPASSFLNIKMES